MKAKAYWFFSSIFIRKYDWSIEYTLMLFLKIVYKYFSR